MKYTITYCRHGGNLQLNWNGLLHGHIVFPKPQGLTWSDLLLVRPHQVIHQENGGNQILIERIPVSNPWTACSVTFVQHYRSAVKFSLYSTEWWETFPSGIPCHLNVEMRSVPSFHIDLSPSSQWLEGDFPLAIKDAKLANLSKCMWTALVRWILLQHNAGLKCFQHRGRFKKWGTDLSRV